MNLTITPSRAEFIRAAADPERRVISVTTRLLADDQTPVGLYAKLCGRRPNTYLLESANAGAWDRWSYIGVNSVATLVGRDGQAQWHGSVPAGLPTRGPELDVLAKTLELLRTPDEPDLPPFHAGLVGFLAYEVVHQLEPSVPDQNPNHLDSPDLVMMLASDLAAYDHYRGELWLVANAINMDGSPERAEQAYDQAVARIEQMVATVREPSRTLSAVRAAPVSHDQLWAQVRRQCTSQEYQSMVRAAVEQIEAGQAFQVVPSQRFEIDCPADPLEVYRELRVTNPSPYLNLMRLEDFSIVCASPEALVTVDGQSATTRPIAGSRPRGATPEADAQFEAELLADEKERAEHVMLVDLGRNDLGRICQPGTVEVTEFMQVSRYSHIMHLEAEVTGRLNPGQTGLQATLACFPAGTLSGAPKISAMRIIDRLEHSRRGPYGGVIGYFDLAGNAAAAIGIRAALIKDGVAHVQAGAGVVADSVPELEDQETMNKAAAALMAAHQAARLTRLEADLPSAADGASGSDGPAGSDGQ